MTTEQPASFRSYRENKIWGYVTHVFSNVQISMSYLRFYANAWCSIHKHLERANSFFVAKGAVLIEIFSEDNLEEPEEVFTLEQGDSHIVPSGIWHRFKTLEAGYMVEVYWPDRGGECRLDDIVRHDTGGRL